MKRSLHVLLTRGISRLLSLSLLIALVLAALPPGVVRAEGPASVLDASFSGATNAMATLDDCCHFVAQTFTAHTTGALTSIRVELTSMAPFSLRFAIHGVTNGVPNADVYGEGGLLASTDEPYITADLARDIPIYTPVYVVAGKQYAIVADYYSNGPGEASGNWWGATGNGYPEGAVFVTNDDSFATWTPANTPGLDLHFQTYVVPNVPASDLSVTRKAGVKRSHACATFSEMYTIRNNGPDTATHVVLGIGLTDQFDVVSVKSVVGGKAGPYTLKPGQSMDIRATIKVTAFVPGESREGRVSAHVFMDAWPDLMIDPVSSNNDTERVIWLQGPGVDVCP